MLRTALLVTAGIVLAHWSMGWLPAGDETWWDATVVPPAFASGFHVAARRFLIPLLAGVLCVVSLHGAAVRRGITFVLPMALAAAVPLALGLITLLVTSESHYRDALWRLHASTEGSIDLISLDGMLDPTISFRLRAVPSFLAENLMVLPITLGCAFFGARLASMPRTTKET